LRNYPADVYDGICADGKAVERMTAVLRYVGVPPVGEIFVMLVALTTVSRASQLYASCARNRWIFFEQLGQWVLMLKIAEVVVHPVEYCYTDEFVLAEQHSTAAAQLMQELIEKLCLEDTGELLLQPLGYSTALLDYFIDCAVDPQADDIVRRLAARLLCFLIRRAADTEIMCIMSAGPGAPPTPTYIANRLYPLRERIVLHIGTRLPDIFGSLSDFRTVDQEAKSQPVKYPGHVVERPFNSLRALLVEVVVLMVESDDMVASKISPELWKELISWTIQYCYNNIYHALFYRLIFAVLR
jgi:hypothetical protein